MKDEYKKRYYLKSREQKAWDDLITYSKHQKFQSKWDEIIRRTNELRKAKVELDKYGFAVKYE